MSHPTPTADESTDTREPLHPRVGVSRCLLGENVRVNGGHCQDKWILNALGAEADLVGVCPEVELGMDTPRPPLRLVADGVTSGVDGIRLVESKRGTDWTEPMAAFAKARAEALASENLDGFILKRGSPTCGVFRVKVYDHNGSPSATGIGLFAEALRQRLPNLPVEEEGRLNDPALRESFLVRVYAHARWKRFCAEDGSSAGLVGFHARHKMLLLAADPTGYRHMGRLVAGHRRGHRELAELLEDYASALLASLARPVSPGRHVNVLQHLLGFCKSALASEEKRELERTRGLYVEGHVSRAAPVSLVRYLLLKHAASPWARQQLYLEPYPSRLAPALGA